MRLIFAGTPEFARVALEALRLAGHDIVLILTQPDRPSGRGMKLQASPVKQLAVENGLAFAQPRSLRLEGKYPDEAATAKAQIQEAGADVMVVAAYGLILPQWVLDIPALGCVNIHASLLPRWRGAAPIHRAIEAGDVQTGVTIMQMDAGLDTGDMLLVERLSIESQDDTRSLQDKLAALGARLIVQALALAECGNLPRTQQPIEGITYAQKIEKTESAVNWRDSAAQIERRIRTFSPSPGCSCMIRGELIKLCAAGVVDATSYQEKSALRTCLDDQGLVLEVNEEGVDVLCGQGSVLRITELQRAGAKRLSVAEFLRGFSLKAGERFEGAKGGLA